MTKNKTVSEKLLDVYYEAFADLKECQKSLEEKEKDLNILRGVLKSNGIPIPEEPLSVSSSNVSDWSAMILDTLRDVHKPTKRGELVKMIIAAYSLNEKDVVWNLNTKITFLARERKIIRAKRKSDDRGGYYVPELWIENGKLKPDYKRFAEGFILELKG